MDNFLFQRAAWRPSPATRTLRRACWPWAPRRATTGGPSAATWTTSTYPTPPSRRRPYSTFSVSCPRISLSMFYDFYRLLIIFCWQSKATDISDIKAKNIQYLRNFSGIILKNVMIFKIWLFKLDSLIFRFHYWITKLLKKTSKYVFDLMIRIVLKESLY